MWIPSSMWRWHNFLFKTAKLECKRKSCAVCMSACRRAECIHQQQLRYVAPCLSSDFPTHVTHRVEDRGTSESTWHTAHFKTWYTAHFKSRLFDSPSTPLWPRFELTSRSAYSERGEESGVQMGPTRASTRNETRSISSSTARANT